MVTFNSNQFKQGAVAGEIDLSSGGLSDGFTVRINPASIASDILSGTGLQLVDGGASDANGVPLVDVLTVNTQVPFGARIFSSKSGSVQPGEITQISWKGNVQRMEAAGALNRGVAVSLDFNNPAQVKAVGTDAKFGILLDKAFVLGDLVRVLVDIEAP